MGKLLEDEKMKKKEWNKATFVDVNVFCRTATVWSCAETSSIVFGRLNMDDQHGK